MIWKARILLKQSKSFIIRIVASKKITEMEIGSDIKKPASVLTFRRGIKRSEIFKYVKPRRCRVYHLAIKKHGVCRETSEAINEFV